MEYYAGIYVSLEASSVCVVASSKIVRETKVANDPQALALFFGELGDKPVTGRNRNLPAVAAAAGRPFHGCKYVM